MKALFLMIATLIISGLLPKDAASQTATTFDVLVATENLTVIGTTTLQGSAFSVGGSTLVITNGNVGIGTTTPRSIFHVVGVGPAVFTLNSSTAEMVFFPSSAAFRAGLSTAAFWNPENIGRYSVAFGLNNQASGFGTAIGGGARNLASGAESVIGGGTLNETDGDHSTVGGGQQDAATNAGASVLGGQGNLASGANSTVGGGYFNFATGDYATAAGGTSNDASGSFSSVAGGFFNDANSAYSNIAGGSQNLATASNASIGGGDENAANGVYSVVSGGQLNTANADYSMVAGGQFNFADGLNSFVAGGSQNSASGDSSFAAGQLANATAAGSFVWADAQGPLLTSNVTNEFKARAGGGFILIGNPGFPTVIASSGSLSISTSATAATSVPNIYISTTGGVGIGTSLPGSRLDVNGDLTVRGSSTFISSGTFLSSATFASGGDDIILTTATTANTGALKVVGRTGGIQVSTGMTFLGIKAPTSSANQGILYYDSTHNAFYVTENGGVAKPIVDPPGNWTCTLRSTSSSSAVGFLTATVSCSGSEKVLTGGCSDTANSWAAGNPYTLFTSAPTGQGWTCGTSWGNSHSVTAYANCCQ